MRKVSGVGGRIAVVARLTAFRFRLEPTPAQVVVLGRHAGAARFAYNQALRLTTDALAARRQDPGVQVPWQQPSRSAQPSQAQKRPLRRH